MFLVLLAGDRDMDNILLTTMCNEQSMIFSKPVTGVLTEGAADMGPIATGREGIGIPAVVSGGHIGGTMPVTSEIFKESNSVTKIIRR